MADVEKENPLGYVDKRKTQRGGDSGNANGNPVAAGVGDASTYASVAGLRTFLGASTAHGAGYYSASRLNTMTKNDMVSAARLIQDAAGI